MGLLVDGHWHAHAGWNHDADGRFVRDEAVFRGFVTADGSSGFPAEPGRYHLYVSYACPWASRTLLYRKLKKLERVIGLSVVHPVLREEGWTFDPYPGSTPDSVNGARTLREIYTMARPDFTGRVTVPVLWDTKKRTIVSNESSDMVRMLNSEFDELGDASVDFYPAELRVEIDAVNSLVYRNVNDGVYRVGFARTQRAHDEAFATLFETLDWLEMRLSERRYLVGNRVTEADWRLFVTLVRFDSVYHGHFKCNLRRLVDYPNLWAYTRELWQMPGVAETVNLDHVKRHYYASHRGINPSGIVPKGPQIDFLAPHGRERIQVRPPGVRTYLAAGRQ